MKDLIIDTEIQAMEAESPLVYARQIAAAELRSDIRPEERAWLTSNPLLWLRALRGMRDEVQFAISRDRARLREVEVEGLTSAQYRAAKTEYEAALIRRRHFQGRVERRINEMRALLGRELASAPIVGEIIDMFLDIVAMIDEDDVEGARKAALSRASHLTRIYHLAEVPDNSGAVPIEIVLPDPLWTEDFYCKACRGQAVSPSNPVCTACGQRHIARPRHAPKGS